MSIKCVFKRCPKFFREGTQTLGLSTGTLDTFSSDVLEYKMASLGNVGVRKGRLYMLSAGPSSSAKSQFRGFLNVWWEGAHGEAPRR
jgi:hypothetical protein